MQSVIGIAPQAKGLIAADGERNVARRRAVVSTIEQQIAYLED